ncbi:vacuolar transporter chaperone [Nowakowskiella sp. JEL0078]|nr:vacuolar transporter chaperone [Nowakowskiella sp. JEL0078]
MAEVHISLSDERTPLLSTQSNGSRIPNVANSTTKSLPFSLFSTPANAGQAAVQATPAGTQRVQTFVRVEPKVFFANERTFLSWLHCIRFFVCIVLGGLAIGLFNFGDRVARISGLAFTFVAVLFMGYSLYLYLWRTKMIRARDPGPYDNTTGPIVLVIILMIAIVMNVFLKLRDGF